jgi:glycosyltransferase involved in cell wall biosynthesis
VKVAGGDTDPDGSRLPTLALETLGLLSAPELRALLARAAIYVLPACYEPFGLSALEAAASRCALVLGDIASLREVWDDAALYVPPADDQALAATINRLIADHGERDRLAERAFERAARYTAEAMTEAYLDAYAALEPSAIRRLA